ncbi:hypothetical protein [Streptomyces sp. NPDC006333]|uniref:hypothetical protein n=1 Tax=Streptomyces sp. NPDC006333 TaxID=3156753 RepID=UPI0033AE3AB7
MTDRMGVLLAALDRQGFKSQQSAQGSWRFTRDGTAVLWGPEPETAGQWLDLIAELRSAGLVFPDED